MDSFNYSRDSNAYRYSTPLPPLRPSAYQHPASHQDTNYIGITISDQDEMPKSQDNHDGKHLLPQLQIPSTDYRHSFNGFSGRSHPGKIAAGNAMTRDTAASFGISPPQPESSVHSSRPPLGHHVRSHSNSSTALSRHASINLPAIITSQPPPHPKLSLSAQTCAGTPSAGLGPRSPHSPHSQTSAFTPGYSQNDHHLHQQHVYNQHQTYPTSPATPRYASSVPMFSPHMPPPQSAFSPVRSAFTALTVPIPEGSLLDFALPDVHLENQSTGRPVEMRGAFRKVKSAADLKHEPPNSTRFRPLQGSGRLGNPLKALTRDLNATYHICNGGFNYNTGRNPRRVLTKPSKPFDNDGFDNEEADYILYVNDILGEAEGRQYLILDVLGSGTFGQVVKCKNIQTQEISAVKVVKNKMAYFKQSMMEVAILEALNRRDDPEDNRHILRLRDTFIHRKHLCLVFELLSVNLYELIKQNQFRGLSTNLVRVFTLQILDALTVLNESRIIHCDLKPENILLKNLESPTIKVIDFGSACYEAQTMYTYIQSRFYRSPEVLLGLPYTGAIDMWSLGCIAAELFLGLPLFPGSSEYNQLSRIVDILGMPPTAMIDASKNGQRYFELYTDEAGYKRYRLRSLEQYSREQGKAEQPSKQYFTAKTLPALISTYPIIRKVSMSPKEIDKEQQKRLAFIDFLQGLLKLDPVERWTPQQARSHPFLTGEPFTGPFQPNPTPIQKEQFVKTPPTPRSVYNKPH